MQRTHSLERIHFLDSHTAGESTRLVVAGAPELGSGPLAERMECLQRSHDWFRSAVVNEPRGSDTLVGALLCEPVDKTAAAGVIFFNNIGYLGMCGHGAIGLIVTLAHLGRIGLGRHQIETPVGTVTATLHAAGLVTIENVPSYRSARSVSLDVPGVGLIQGDVAYGGNWFFLVEHHARALEMASVEALTNDAWAIRQALVANNITGSGGEEIDHIEIFGPPANGTADSRNFVLCPGKAYDRSPCGTGTSAKMACLYEDGKLHPGQVWRQEGILGTVFEGSIDIADGRIKPTITGAAYVTAEGTLLLDPNDPFRTGIPK